MNGLPVIVKKFFYDIEKKDYLLNHYLIKEVNNLKLMSKIN